MPVSEDHNVCQREGCNGFTKPGSRYCLGMCRAVDSQFKLLEKILYDDHSEQANELWCALVEVSDSLSEYRRLWDQRQEAQGKL